MSIIETNFVKPTPKPELGGELGLYASEIAKSLGIANASLRVKLNKRGLLKDLQDNNLTALTFVTPNKTNGLGFEEFVFTEDAARYVVAKWNNKQGNAYLAFLVKLHKAVDDFEQQAKEDPLTANMLQNIQLRKQQLDQAKVLKTMESKIEAIPNIVKADTIKTVKEKFDEVLEKNSDLPKECIRIDEIGPKYFKGTPRNKWKTYLEAKKHPKKGFLYRGEGGAVPSSAFIEEGLNQAALEFYREREFLRETPKLRFYSHPLVGTMQERKE